MKMSEDEWRARLTDRQYSILREGGTEPPFTGDWQVNDKPGVYRCIGCGNVLFDSSTSFESTTPGLIGWPSFSEVANSDAVRLEHDYRYGMHRIEVLCAGCDSHLGHYFDDPASPNGAHYCINSCVYEFSPESLTS